MGTLGAGPASQVSRELGYTSQPQSELPAGFSQEAAGTATQISFMSEAPALVGAPCLASAVSCFHCACWDGGGGGSLPGVPVHFHTD